MILNVKKPETFQQLGAFKGAIEGVLNRNRTNTDFDQLGLLANREPQVKDTISAILKR